MSFFVKYAIFWERFFFNLQVTGLIWSQDLRVQEVRRLLQSSRPVRVSVVQLPEVSDHEYIEEKENKWVSLLLKGMFYPLLSTFLIKLNFVFIFIQFLCWFKFNVLHFLSCSVWSADFRLLQLCQRTMALPVGRGLFTLFSYHPVPTEPLPVPKLNLTGTMTHKHPHRLIQASWCSLFYYN